MPNYEYRCKECNKDTEVTKPISESSTPEICKECGKEMIRLISLCGFSLSGKGWARDGYSK